MDEMVEEERMEGTWRTVGREEMVKDERGMNRVCRDGEMIDWESMKNMLGMEGMVAGKRKERGRMEGMLEMEGWMKRDRMDGRI
jgi:hypothetical protein